MTQCHATPDIQQYLRELSSRTRALRKRLRKTRKDLARESGISERYLAQIEGGHANPSLSLLCQLARALGVRFQDLLGDHGGRRAAGDPLGELVQGLPSTERQAAYELLTLRFGVGDAISAQQS